MQIKDENRIEENGDNSGRTEYPEKVILKSEDEEEFELEAKVALQSETIKNMLEDGFDDCIPLPNVSGSVLAKVIEYWKHHVTDVPVAAKFPRMKTVVLDEFDKEFVNVPCDELVHLVMAANYLCCKPLVDLICQEIADRIKDYTVEEARNFFGIENDFTPEEEKKIREENAWAYDP